MKINTKKLLQGLMLVPALALAVSFTAPAVANAQLQSGIDATGQNTSKDNTSPTQLVGTVVNWFLFFVGAVAVIMLIYGGFKYITSGGDSSNVTSAKNTILYAVIGLVVVVLAGTIINFVINGNFLSNPT